MRYRELGEAAYREASASRLARLVASQRVSPVELAELALALAKRHEPKVNAYVLIMEKYALAEAGKREAEARRGRLRGRLHGVPIAVKDNYYLKGFPATRGSRTSVGYMPGANSPAIDRVLAAGAVIIGKTTMPEFGWKGTGISPLTGVTRNPWNTALNSGGSSAGSAATVATGAVPIALGSDAGGSIRIPAAFCGTVGLKPTLGRIPVWPGTVTESLSHQGPLCRDVEDAALTLAVCAGPDPRDPMSAGAFPVPDRARAARLREGALRVGVIDSPFGFPVTEAVREVVAGALAQLRRGLRARWKAASIDAALPRGVFETLWVTGRGLGFASTIAKQGDVMDPGLARLAGLAAQASLGDFFQALVDRREFNAQAFALFEDHDILAMPTMPLLPFAADAEVPPGGEADAPLPWVTWTPFTYPFNLSGQPAISLPCGFTAEGLPVGLQLVAPWGEDNLLLAVARRAEKLLRQRLPQRVAPL